jgi:hypothetical protein
VLLAHWEHSFLDDTLKIIDECPYGVCEVEFRALVWAPQIGQRLCEWAMPLVYTLLLSLAHRFRRLNGR